MDPARPRARPRTWIVVVALALALPFGSFACIPRCDRENICTLEDTLLCDGTILRPCDPSTLGDTIPCPAQPRFALCTRERWELLPVTVAPDGGGVQK